MTRVFDRDVGCPACGNRDVSFVLIDAAHPTDPDGLIGWSEWYCPCDQPPRPYEAQGERRRQVRVRSARSLAEIAPMLGVRPVDLSSWERGVSWPDDPAIVALWDATLGMATS